MTFEVLKPELVTLDRYDQHPELRNRVYEAMSTRDAKIFIDFLHRKDIHYNGVLKNLGDELGSSRLEKRFESFGTTGGGFSVRICEHGHPFHKS